MVGLCEIQTCNLIVKHRKIALPCPKQIVVLKKTCLEAHGRGGYCELLTATCNNTYLTVPLDKQWSELLKTLPCKRIFEIQTVQTLFESKNARYYKLLWVAHIQPPSPEAHQLAAKGQVVFKIWPFFYVTNNDFSEELIMQNSPGILLNWSFFLIVADPNYSCLPLNFTCLPTFYAHTCSALGHIIRVRERECVFKLHLIQLKFVRVRIESRSAKHF